MVDASWVQVRTYGALYEADLAVATLEAAGISTLVKGPGAGVFGPGVAGHSPIPVRVYVPSDSLGLARELLESPQDTGPDV